MAIVPSASVWEGVIRQWMQTPEGIKATKSILANTNYKEVLRDAAKDFVRFLSDEAISWSNAQGFSRPFYGGYGTGWGGDTRTENSVRITQTNNNSTSIRATIHIPPADLDDFLSISTQEYNRVYDIIGLMTQGYTSSKCAYGYNRYGVPITSHRLGEGIWGFRPGNFVQDAIHKFEAEYDHLGAKVVSVPANWQ